MGRDGSGGSDFEAFYRCYFKATARAVRAIVREDAEDVAQDAFLKLREVWGVVGE